MVKYNRKPNATKTGFLSDTQGTFYIQKFHVFCDPAIESTGREYWFLVLAQDSILSVHLP